MITIDLTLHELENLLMIVNHDPYRANDNTHSRNAVAKLRQARKDELERFAAENPSKIVVSDRKRGGANRG